MNKEAFILALTERLSRLPRVEVDERLSFYLESIDDRMEEGLSEEAAVAAVGSVDEIVSQILSDIPLSVLVKERIKPQRRLGVGTTLLLILGSPVWLPLLIAGFAVALSVYLSLWSAVISLWAVFASLVGCAFGGVAGGIVFAATGRAATGIAVIGCGILCAGLSAFLFYGCKAATKGTILIAKAFFLRMKKEAAR